MPDDFDLSPDLQRKINPIISKLNKVNFHVLIWGSGSTDVANYQKRLKIRQYLANLLGDKRVHMSEDTEFRALVESYGLRGAEELEARGVDAIVVLDTSIGPHTEILAYESILRHKGIVFVKDEFKESAGFAATVYRTLQAEGYSDEEFEDCNFIRQTTRDFVQGLRFKKAKNTLDKVK